MQDLKLIAINTNQTFVALAVQNTGINPVGNTNPIEILLFHNEYNSIVLDYILNSLEKERIIRDLHRHEIAKLMDKIIKLQS